MAAEEPHQQLDLFGERTSTLKGLNDRPFEEDTSAANGASIAMLAEFEIRSVLLTGMPTPSSPQAPPIGHRTEGQPSW
jgi:hypothetical protein